MNRTNTAPMPRRSYQSSVTRTRYETKRNNFIVPQRQSHYSGYINYDKALKHRHSPATIQRQQPSICLIIAAHNEELVLEQTIRSAIYAGMLAEHIYVVDDCSSDKTSQIARSILPRQNVHRVRRSGKGLALAKAAKKFDLSERYGWIHIADADGVFAPDYFSIFIKHLRAEYAAATGYIRSLPGKRISEYRVFEYTVGMELHRRIQSLLGVISIIPGPTSCFRADVFAKLDFSAKALTEDFDVTMQIYRQGLGKIQFIPQAVAYTQDPLNLKGFVRQITRWNRGVMQGIVKYKIGRKLSAIDAYLSYQLVQSLLLFLNFFVWMPYMTITRGGASFLAMAFLFDVMITFFIALFAGMRSKRWDAVSAFPILYGLKWVSLAVFMKSFVEVIVLRKFRLAGGGWDSGGARRYRLRTT